jgi:hypothetical protein
MVRCSTCGARWRALPEGASDDDEALPGPLDDIVAEPAGAADAEPPLDFVVPTKPARPPKAKTSPLMVAASVAVVLLALVAGGVIVMREAVARAVPGAAEVFAAIGLPVDTHGLIIEHVAFAPQLVGGQPVLAVTGQVRNIRHEATNSPPIRFSFLDKAGKPLGGRVAQPLASTARVPPGGVRYFTINLPDPPANARKLEVGFETEKTAPTQHE